MAKDSNFDGTVTPEMVATPEVQASDAPINVSVSGTLSQAWPEPKHGYVVLESQDPSWIESLARQMIDGNPVVANENYQAVMAAFVTVTRHFSALQRKAAQSNIAQLNDTFGEAFAAALVKDISIKAYNNPDYFNTQVEDGITLGAVLTAELKPLSPAYKDYLRGVVERAPAHDRHETLVADFMETMIYDAKYSFSDALLNNPDAEINMVDKLRDYAFGELQKHNTGKPGRDNLAAAVLMMGNVLPEGSPLELAYWQGVSHMLMVHPQDLDTEFKGSGKSMADIMVTMPESMVSQPGKIIADLAQRTPYVQTYVPPVPEAPAAKAAAVAVVELPVIDQPRQIADVINYALDRSRDSQYAVLNPARNLGESFSRLRANMKGIGSKLSTNMPVLLSQISTELGEQVHELWRRSTDLSYADRYDAASAQTSTIMSRIEAISAGIDRPLYKVAFLQGCLDAFRRGIDTSKTVVANLGVNFFDALTALPEQPLADKTVMETVYEERQGPLAFNSVLWKQYGPKERKAPTVEQKSRVSLGDRIAGILAQAYPLPPMPVGYETVTGFAGSLQEAVDKTDVAMGNDDAAMTVPVVDTPDGDPEDLDIPAIFSPTPDTDATRVLKPIDDYAPEEFVPAPLNPTPVHLTAAELAVDALVLTAPQQAKLDEQTPQIKGISKKPQRLKAAAKKARAIGAKLPGAATAALAAVQASRAERHAAEAPLREKFKAETEARREQIGVKARDLGVQLRKGTLDFKDRAEKASLKAQLSAMDGTRKLVGGTVSTAKNAWAAMPGKERIANGARTAWNAVPAEARPMAVGIALAVVGIGSIALVSILAMANHHIAPGNDILMTAATGAASAAKTGAEHGDALSQAANAVQQVATSETVASAVTQTATVAHKAAQHSEVVTQVASVALPADATPADMIRQVSVADSGNGVVKIMNTLNANGQQDLASEFVRCAQAGDDACKADVVQRAGLGDMLKSLVSGPRAG